VTMTGAELRRLRRAAGLTQGDLASHAGYGREAVGYWEAKAGPIACRYGAVRRFLDALGIDPAPYLPPRAEARPDPLEAHLQAALAQWRARQAERLARQLAARRVKCGAKTRKGSPCRNESEPGKRRCKFHGGRSTGAKTPEGRARIAEAQRQRWARYHAGLSTKTETPDSGCAFLNGGNG
jgi:transcriptional regulator with XRE-family HTH domain